MQDSRDQDEALASLTQPLSFDSPLLLLLNVSYYRRLNNMFWQYLVGFLITFPRLKLVVLQL